MRNKITHLNRRWSQQEPEVGEWEGVAISDEKIDRYVEQSGITSKLKNDIPIYGNTTISENQRELLQLPPGFTTYQPIVMREIEADVEVMMNKAGWEDRKKREREWEVFQDMWEPCILLNEFTT